jgi:hypothetical protein
MIVKIFHECVNQATTKNIKEDLQKLEDKINIFGEKGVLINNIKYEKKIQKDQMQQQLIITFVHHTTINEEIGQVEKDDIPKIVSL